MLKVAYNIGFKLAMDEYGLTPEQLAAAQNLNYATENNLSADEEALLRKMRPQSDGELAGETAYLDENENVIPQEDYSQSALGLMPYGPDSSNYMGLESSGYYPEY